MKRLIAKIFPRHWCLTANGGIEVRRLVPATRFTPGLHRWSVFSRVRVGGGILPIDSFGQHPLKSGFAMGDEGCARCAAGVALCRLQGVARG